MKMERKVRMLSLGQGQGVHAQRLIEEGTQKGSMTLKSRDFDANERLNDFAPPSPPSYSLS
jgi:hypothetical protein